MQRHQLAKYTFSCASGEEVPYEKLIPAWVEGASEEICVGYARAAKRP